MYKTLMSNGGTIHFKTDNTGLFDYTLSLWKERDDIEIILHSHDFYSLFS